MSIFRSVFTISFYISLSRIVGFIRDIVIAQFLGVSILSDVFFAAFRLPNFFRRVFAEGAFNSAFVPISIEKMSHETGRSGEIKFARNAFSIMLYVLLIFTLIFQIFMPFFMKILFPGFFTDPEKSELLVALSRITIFYLIFISLVSLLSGILNSSGKFAVPASSPIILNTTLILSIFIFGSYTPNYAYALSWGVFVAGILQFFWLLFFTIRAGFLIYPTAPQFNSDIKKLFKKLLPGIIGANVMQINPLIDSVFASMIFGAMSYLYYADRINQLPLAMIGIAIGIALLPALSRKIKDGKDRDAIRLQNAALEVALILVVPATLALTVLAYPIISTLFERGKFTANESYFVADALLLYSFGLPSFALVKVMEPGFFARGNTSTPMKIAIVCLVTNLALNVFFAHLDFGYVGIILSSIFSSYINLTLIFTILIRNKQFRFERNFSKKLISIITPAIIMSLVLFVLREYFNKSEQLNKIIELTIMISVGLLTYAISSYLSGSLNILIKSNLFKRKKNDAILPSS